MQKNSSTSKVPLIETSDFSSMFAENRYIEWISSNGKILTYILLGILAVAFLIYRMSSSNRNQAEKDYFNAANEVSQLQRLTKVQDLVGAQEVLGRLTTIMQRHPELHAQYDGTIAQLLINVGNTEEAKKFSIPALSRVSQDHISHYIDYASNTLVISAQQYPEALKQALNLKQNLLALMSANQEFNQSEFDNVYTLFALNFLRIGMLQEKMNDKEEELKTWQDWRQYTKTKNPISAAFLTLNEVISEGNITLADYIEHREELLRK